MKITELNRRVSAARRTRRGANILAERAYHMAAFPPKERGDDGWSWIAGVAEARRARYMPCRRHASTAIGVRLLA